jgi:hypothetical protein
MSDIIRQRVIEMFEYNPLFSKFEFNSFNIQKIWAPEIGEYYDFNFISNTADRWVFLRIEDFGKQKKMVIWINFLKNKKPINFDVESYFNLYIKTVDIKGRFSFNSNSQEELIERLSENLEYIVKHSDEKLRDVILGKKWVELGFDWHDYK